MPPLPGHFTYFSPVIGEGKGSPTSTGCFYTFSAAHGNSEFCSHYAHNPRQCAKCTALLGEEARVAARKREWTTIKVIAKHTEKAAHPRSRSLSWVRWMAEGGRGGVEVQKQKHRNFVPRDGQAVLWGILVSCPGVGEWGDCTFCTFLGNGIGIVHGLLPWKPSRDLVS